MDNKLPDILGNRAPSMKEIQDFQEAASKLPQVDFPVRHHYSENVYVREFHMPAGHFVIGKKHKTRHLNILTHGSCSVWTPAGYHQLNAINGPVTFESMAHVKKVVLAHTDIVWMTVHPGMEKRDDHNEGSLIDNPEQMDLFPELDIFPIHGGNTQ